jgi:hypothetical protein
MWCPGLVSVRPSVQNYSTTKKKRRKEGIAMICVCSPPKLMQELNPQCNNVKRREIREMIKV